LPVKGGEKAQRIYLQAWRIAHPEYFKYWMRKKRSGERIMQMKGSRTILGARVDFQYFELGSKGFSADEEEHSSDSV